MEKVVAFKKQLKKSVVQFFLKRKVYHLQTKGKTVNLVIGAGPTHFEGWLMTDLPVLDALNPSDWNYIFPRSSIYRILVEHVIEHWTEDEFCSFLKIVRPFPTKQGFIRIAVPDGFHPDPAYVDYVKPGGGGSGAGDHKVLYNYVTIAKILCKVQYDFKLLEYFDEAGQFHQSKWATSDGFVHRSANYDPRNREEPLSYTSLIVDTWPSGKSF